MPTKPKHDWSQFTLKVAIKKPISTVFKAWTDGKIISEWFTEKAILEPKKNGRIYFEWLAGDKMEAKVISVSKNRYLTIPFGMNGERVTVKFKKDGRGCICELRHYNMKTTPKAKWEMHRGCIQGWTFFLANLKNYLENGIDLRSHDPKRSYQQDFMNS
ncbi:MAG: SRPBCC domain-containing protein [candidate division Zixibacteria bacterium]